MVAIRNIVTEGDEILRKKCRDVAEINDRIKITLDDMLETMRLECGVGIAAPQVGIMTVSYTHLQQYLRRQPLVQLQLLMAA